MSKPRSGIPTPGRPSGGIPTPGSRSRSSSLAASTSNSSNVGGAMDQDMSAAFKDAIRANDPANYAAGVGRASLASSSSTSSAGGLRSKTPTSFARPPSRSSDVFARSSSRAGGRNSFEVGDMVRIESLGFEGVLRYMGEIDGKQGLWAGVELSGGFAGKGKNDGSVAGKRYFSCPEKCGVFVATTKLSPPAFRPPSVASSVTSSRTGRTTPLSAFSNSFSTSTTNNSTSTSRVPTSRPSLANGRITPSAGGRVTPSNSLSTSTTSVPETPAARAARLRSLSRNRPQSKSTAGSTPGTKGRTSGIGFGDAPPVPVPGVSGIASPGASLTPGSRAAKYAGMTAKQLALNKSLSSPSSRTLSPSSSTSAVPSPSPTRRTASGGAASASGIASPFSTPKPRLGGPGTPSGGTPRPRVPSAMAMPPPASPVRGGKTSTSPPSNSQTAASTADLEARGKALQEKIASLTGISTPSSPPPSQPTHPTQVPSAPSSPVKRPQSRTTYSRPSSVASTRSTASKNTHTPGTASFGRSVGPGNNRAPSRTGGRTSVAGVGGRTSVSGRVSVTPQDQEREFLDRMEQLQSRVDALEYENGRLRVKAKAEEEVEDLKEEVKRLEERLASSTPGGSSYSTADEGGGNTIDVSDRKGDADAKLRDKIRELETALREAEDQSEQFALKAEELEARLASEGRRGSDAGDSSSAAAAAKEMSKLQSQLKERDAEIELLKSDLDTAQVSRAAPDSGTDPAQLEALKTELDGVKAQLEQKEKELGDKVQALETKETELEKAKAELESTQSQLATAQSELGEATSSLTTTQSTLESTQSTLSTLEAKHRKQTIDFEEERRNNAALVDDLKAQVDELRMAGQETIALYEDKLRGVESAKWDLENQVEELEKALKEAGMRPGAGTSRKGGDSRRSSATLGPDEGEDGDQTLSKILNGNHKQTASEIEHSTLLDQIAHLNKKVSSLEDLLEDQRASFDREEAALQARVGKYREREEQFKREMGELQVELRRERERGEREEERLRARMGEVEEALRESGVALEEARAEVEGLKGELVNVHGLAASTSSTSGELQQKLSSAQMKAELEKEQLEERIRELQLEVDSLRKKTNRDVAINNGLQSPVKDRESKDKELKHELKSANEEITGLKHLLQELQKESTVQSQRNKVLESENALLISEMGQLRQEVKILEDNLDQSIMREEENLNLDMIGKDGEEGAGGEVEKLKKMLKEQRLKFDVEVEQLRKKLADVEMKSARSTHDLNKEISELEALVESKIYREDELEQEIERLKDKLARAQKKAKSSTTPSEIVSSEHGPRKASISASSIQSSSSLSQDSQTHGDEPVCEICERPGHDIFNCDLLKEDRPLSTTSSISSLGEVNGKTTHASDDLWCEDCESPGHTAEDCPNSEDVF
ncbi:hypothetical protein K435DRAFT_960070 [Dendrothele bispora CBS 962.96]|uniref:CAP-Gly domain-containing protein n=1 Tax=Dendrothele bispora (strain CBS 962.96) TaxID=1314807 RepID=A0A4S8MUZ0_DENBC|nr:hypothetical protein K435DRAFT_960070 [Dendrothele bispora CBS 962.96]